MRRAIGFLFALCLFPVFCFPQANDLSLTFGGLTSSTPGVSFCEAIITCLPLVFDVKTGFALEANFAHRLVGIRVASLDLEMPLMVSPSRGTSALLPSIGTVIPHGDISTLFFTPSLRLKIAPRAPFSPFVSVGGGLAHYNVNSTNTNKGAFQVGAGADFKTPIPLLSLRIEFRDFVSGEPNFGAGTIAGIGVRDNFYFAGGVVFRF